MSLLKAILDGNEREIKRLRGVVATINSWEPKFEGLTDEQLGAKTDEFRQRLANGEPLDDILPEAFAVVREAAKRTLGIRHYDVQMVGGLVLHQGRIAEMATGEGKTLVGTAPLYLNALDGKGVHLVTVNDYLAKRDAVWNAPIYHLLGLSVAVIQSHPHGAAYRYDPEYKPSDPHFNYLRPIHRYDAYRCDVLYGTNAEFGFDYLRDNGALALEHLVQRELNYAIVDEVDSILVDEARTPLIISGLPQQSTDLYYRVDRVVARLQHERDYTVDEKAKTAMLTDEGVGRVEEGLSVANLADDQELMHHVNAALKARYVYKRDIDYVVKDDGEGPKVIIVDEFTGRLMFGRRYSDGLHQAIEAKEGVRIEEETQTIATITLQNYFRLYHKLAGMTGTAKTEEGEFRKIYGMDVVVIPTHRPMIRKDFPDIIYKTEEAKFRGIVGEILQLHARSQPVLVGTRSIETSERLSERLLSERLQVLAMTIILRDKLYSMKGLDKEKEAEYHALLNTKLDELFLHKLAPLAKTLGVDVNPLTPSNIEDLARSLGVQGATERLAEALEIGIPHSVLNAKYHEKEAEIIAEAGRKGAVTIATNMAGRGVDILLGGRPAEGQPPNKEDQDAVRATGGLAIIGSERHESRRIDRQLRGRSGRQGDPGQSRFYLSLEDELWRLFGDKGNRFLAGWTEDQPLEAKLLTAAIERAQKKVEEHNFGIRKHTLEYDDVMNVQRALIYGQRRLVLDGEDLRDTILGHMREMVEAAVGTHCGSEVQPEEWDLQNLYLQMDHLFDLALHAKPDDLKGKDREELVEFLTEWGEQRYEQKEQEIANVGADMREIERQLMLQIIDAKWIEHLTAMDYLRDGIYLRGYAQQDPLVAYKKEAHEMFEALKDTIQDDVVGWVYHLRLVQQAPPPPRRIINPIEVEPETGGLSLPGENGFDDSDDDLDPAAHLAPRAAHPPRTSHSGEASNGGGAHLPKVGRNDPCPCGSGKKYKKCHLLLDQ
jgi:preprotein translocase subunit SecA